MSFKSKKRYNIFYRMLLYVIYVVSICILLNGCATNEKASEATGSVIVDNAIDELTIKRQEKEEEYMSQDIIDKIKSTRLVSSYSDDTLVDDMESVLFGRCCQEDEYGKDYIDWLVLYRDDEKALLLSKYILDNVSFSLTDTDTTWDMSYIRKWLNEDFYVNAFDDSEKSIVLSPIIYNPPNTRWTISGGTDTMDRVFLLSDVEVKKYFTQEDMYGENKRLATYPTPYAKNVDNYTSKLWTAENKDKWYYGYCSYYLRTPGVSQTEVSVVNQYGYLDTFGAKCRSYNYGIRPAMWIDINDIEE